MAKSAAVAVEDIQGFPMVDDGNGWRLGTVRMAVAVVVGDIATLSVPGKPLEFREIRSTKRSKFSDDFTVKFKSTSSSSSRSATI